MLFLFPFAGKKKRLPFGSREEGEAVGGDVRCGRRLGLPGVVTVAIITASRF